MPMRSKRAAAISAAATFLIAVAAVTTGLVVAFGGGRHTARAAAKANPQPQVQTSYDSGASRSQAGTTDQQGQRAVLGVSVDDSNGKVTVRSVVPGSGADKAGVKAGDVITAVDGNGVAAFADLQKALTGKNAGDSVTLSLDRNGAKVDLKVALGSLPSRPAGAANAGRGFLGVSVANVDDASKQKYSLNTGDGALITNVQNNGPAAGAGLKVGDLISAVNGTTIKTVDDLQNALQNSKPGDSVTVQYQRAGASQTATITLGTNPGPGSFRSHGPNGGSNSGSQGQNGQANGPRQGLGALPFLPGLGGALGQNFDRFISADAKYKDQNGQTHTDTAVGGVVQSASATQVQVNLNGGGSQTFEIDGNTRVLKGPGRGQQPGGNNGANALAQNDKVVVVTEDGSTTAKLIVVVPSGGFAANIGASSSGGSGGQASIEPGNGGITIRTPNGGNNTIPLPGSDGNGGQPPRTY